MTQRNGLYQPIFTRVKWGAVLLAFYGPQSAQALNFSAGALAGYEVLSLRDDPTKLTGGSVSAGDSFDQTSYTGAQVGLATQVGVTRLGEFEPIVALELLRSQLKKTSVADGYTTSGRFSFVNGTLGIGSRMWLGDALALNAVVGMSQAFKNELVTAKSSVTAGSTVGEISYDVKSHKRTTLQLGAAFMPAGNGLTVGIDFRIGSGCYECSAAESAKVAKAYLTRSGVLNVAWLLGQQSPQPISEPQFRKQIPRDLKKIPPVRNPLPKMPVNPTKNLPKAPVLPETDDE